MANSVMELRCKWCGESVALAKGYYGDMEGLVKECKINDFIEEHGGNCEKCEDNYDSAVEHFELVEYYDKYSYDKEYAEHKALYELYSMYIEKLKPNTITDEREEEEMKHMMSAIVERLRKLGETI